MPICSCPKDRQTIPSKKRVEYQLPGAFVRSGPIVVKDQTKIIIFHADCLVHGVQFIKDEKDACPSKT